MNSTLIASNALTFVRQCPRIRHISSYFVVVVLIRPSAAIRQNYNEIADMCRKTAEPVFLTKNGEGDLVVMDIETYNRREKMLKLREELLAVEEDRMRGSKGYSVDEVTAMMRSAIKEAAGHGTAE